MQWVPESSRRCQMVGRIEEQRHEKLGKASKEGKTGPVSEVKAEPVSESVSEGKTGPVSEVRELASSEPEPDHSKGAIYDHTWRPSVSQYRMRWRDGHAK